jgi:hypothetical protein
VSATVEIFCKREQLPLFKDMNNALDHIVPEVGMNWLHNDEGPEQAPFIYFASEMSYSQNDDLQ